MKEGNPVRHNINAGTNVHRMLHLTFIYFTSAHVCCIALHFLVSFTWSIPWLTAGCYCRCTDEARNVEGRTKLPDHQPCSAAGYRWPWVSRRWRSSRILCRHSGLLFQSARHLHLPGGLQGFPLQWPCWQLYAGLSGASRSVWTTKQCL